MKFKIEKLDVSVAVLAALSCVLMAAQIEIPVWALFIGWAWYFTLGAKPELIWQGIAPSLCGAVLAVIAFLLILGPLAGLPWLWGTIIAVLITVFLLMLTLKIPALNISLMSFNAYSCIFVGYAAGTFHHINGLNGYVNAVLWITGANILGLVFGWLSIKLTTLGAKKEEPVSA
jgi:hypothetical protein